MTGDAAALHGAFVEAALLVPPQAAATEAARVTAVIPSARATLPLRCESSVLVKLSPLSIDFVDLSTVPLPRRAVKRQPTKEREPGGRALRGSQSASSGRHARPAAARGRRLHRPVPSGALEHPQRAL